MLKGIKLSFGKNVKDFTIEFMSNSRILDEEFEKYKMELRSSYMNIPTMEV